MKQALLAFVVLTAFSVFVGCVPDSKAPPAKSDTFEDGDFTLPQTHKDKLKSVGCEVIPHAVNCEEVRDDDLAARKQDLEKRQKVLEEVSKDVAGQAGASLSAERNASQQAMSRGLKSAAKGTGVELAQTAARVLKEQVKEQQFGVVSGFSCAGNSAGGESDALRADLVFGEKSTPKSFPIGKAELNGKQVDMDLHTAWHQVVQTDAEFTLNNGGTQKLDLTCLKTRASGAEKAITDRPAKKREMQCSIILTSPKKTEQGKMNLLAPNVSFMTSASDIARQENLIEKFKLSDPFDVNNELLYLYSLKVVSDHGLLAFKIFNTGTQEVMSTLTVSNSAPHVEIQFHDTLNNSVSVFCGDDE